MKFKFSSRICWFRRDLRRKLLWRHARFNLLLLHSAQLDLAWTFPVVKPVLPNFLVVRVSKLAVISQFDGDSVGHGQSIVPGLEV